MFPLTNKPAIAARLYTGLMNLASDPVRGIDTMCMVQYMAGVMVETVLVFEEPDEALHASFQKLCRLLGSSPLLGDMVPEALPPAHIIDHETEKGRAAARELFEEWMDCEFEFHELILTIMHNIIVSWEADGQPRGETMRLLIECALRCMAFEIAAQELCDVVIEQKVKQNNWSINDCIAGLSAVSGVRLAMSLNSDIFHIFRGADLPSHLDELSSVMTQEAVRLGVPAGTDWRFGLPANDTPVNAPFELINGLEPVCEGFFKIMNLQCHYDQAVATAKAAGRMLAVASGGENPEVEPAIAKPLAMAAITESYKSICIDQNMMVAY